MNHITLYKMRLGVSLLHPQLPDPLRYYWDPLKVGNIYLCRDYPLNHDQLYTWEFNLFCAIIYFWKVPDEKEDICFRCISRAKLMLENQPLVFGKGGP